MSRVTALAILAVWVLSAADHYTTYLMLANPIPGWEVWEANPAAKWLFDTFGLISGLVIDSVFTMGAGVWVYMTGAVSEKTKIVWVLVICMGTLYAVHNNIHVLNATGIW